MVAETAPRGSPRLQALVCLFGGIESMARKLGHNHGTTVRGWLQRDTIPHWRRREIIDAAKREGIKLPKWFNGA